MLKTGLIEGERWGSPIALGKDVQKSLKSKCLTQTYEK